MTINISALKEKVRNMNEETFTDMRIKITIEYNRFETEVLNIKLEGTESLNKFLKELVMLDNDLLSETINFNPFPFNYLRYTVLNGVLSECTAYGKTLFSKPFIDNNCLSIPMPHLVVYNDFKASLQRDLNNIIKRVVYLNKESDTHTIEVKTSE